jgi:hypothetical protein
MPTARNVTVFAISLMIYDSATLWLGIHHGDKEKDFLNRR